ncbi:hypothetical protein HYPSUDRAFT_86673 [Hypholoma sublateritium FD-334 SS-4]|uniref:Uncharacterized protein n=1 Tax=Hypholoma sublateritium (strain FD-334 SS-4) TaxID=945553 RepID=A0A0D2L8K9_HYPSF|nr:hypothetical protein HYPSUDRAFT_86673 [Hypholoma sublateritium FD-334 SS-4]
MIWWIDPWVSALKLTGTVRTYRALQSRQGISGAHGPRPASHVRQETFPKLGCKCTDMHRGDITGVSRMTLEYRALGSS